MNMPSFLKPRINSRAKDLKNLMNAYEKRLLIQAWPDIMATG